MTPMTLPRWLPAAAALAFIAWAVTIWWMVATLPAGATESDPVLADVIAEVERLNGEIETLAQQLAALQAAAPVAAPTPTPPRASEASEETADATASDVPAAEATPAVSRFFTNGQDRYNCRDFATYADAQEALRVNRPGDPNRIDMNGNNEACEDFAYPDRPRGIALPAATPAASAATPVATATPKPSN